jgi:hypothetical protein
MSTYAVDIESPVPHGIQVSQILHCSSLSIPADGVNVVITDLELAVFLDV